MNLRESLMHALLWLLTGKSTILLTYILDALLNWRRRRSNRWTSKESPRHSAQNYQKLEIIEDGIYTHPKAISRQNNAAFALTFVQQRMWTDMYTHFFHMILLGSFPTCAEIAYNMRQDTIVDISESLMEFEMKCCQDSKARISRKRLKFIKCSPCMQNQGKAQQLTSASNLNIPVKIIFARHRSHKASLFIENTILQVAHIS